MVLAFFLATNLVRLSFRNANQIEVPAISSTPSTDELKALVEAAHLPLTVNGMARGTLPPGHPLFFPRARGPALGEADLIVAIGALLDFRLNFGQPPVFAEDARLVFVDVDDHRKHRAPDVSLYGDLKAALAALAEALSARLTLSRAVFEQ